jgi:hypothetical protein
MKKMIEVLPVAIAASILGLSALPAQSETLKNAYCSRNWAAAQSIANQSYQTLAATDPKKGEWLKYSNRMSDYKTGTKQPSAAEWKVMGCAASTNIPNSGVTNSGVTNSGVDDTNVVVTKDGRVIDFRNLNGAESKIPVTYIPGRSNNGSAVNVNRSNSSYVAPQSQNIEVTNLNNGSSYGYTRGNGSQTQVTEFGNNGSTRCIGYCPGYVRSYTRRTGTYITPYTRN